MILWCRGGAGTLGRKRQDAAQLRPEADINLKRLKNRKHRKTNENQ